jgi:hypothetical protein
MGGHRIKLLKRLGFRIEDASDFGPEWYGWCRWLHNGVRSELCYDGTTEAWRGAWAHALAHGLIS